MSLRVWLGGLGLLVSLALVACGDDDAPPVEVDGGVDGGSLDANVDASGEVDAGVDAALLDGGVDASTIDSGPPGCTADGACDDGIDCTADRCNTVTGVCRNVVTPDLCAAGESCNPVTGCEAGRACAVDVDCMDADACTSMERCDPAARVCTYLPLDGDSDGVPPRICGGMDCDDSRATVYGGAAEECDGVDNDCDTVVDDACVLSDPSLLSLVTSVGALSPAFAGETTMYTLALPAGTSSVTFTPSVALPTHATILVNGVLVASGSASGAVTMSGFVPTPVTIVVTTDSGATRTYTVVVVGSSRYVKASNTGARDEFGTAVALSSDGSTLAVSAIGEDSNATGVDGNQANNSAGQAGAVYVFVRSGSSWSQEAYLKASNARAGSSFGSALTLSVDGSTLAVGARGERSNATGVDGDQADAFLNGAGAVYVFTRAGSSWSQQSYLKASNTDASDYFGRSVALSGDGSTLAVGAHQEDSIATGIGGDENDDGADAAGAVYIFIRAGSSWAQQAYVKASNTNPFDYFGSSIALSGDGSTLAVGAVGEASSATGVGSDQADNSAPMAGAVYVFTRAGAAWSQQSYLKASNTDADDQFGHSLALSSDGSTLAVGAVYEASNATGIGGDQDDSSAPTAGAVYVFTRAGASWSQQAYLKASNAATNDRFGTSVALAADGSTLAVGANYEASNATGVSGNQADESAGGAGACYVFTRAGSAWSQQAYVKASNTNLGDYFGTSVSLSSDGFALAVGASDESSNATGVDGDQTINSASSAGAVYVY